MNWFSSAINYILIQESRFFHSFLFPTTISSPSSPNVSKERLISNQSLWDKIFNALNPWEIDRLPPYIPSKIRGLGKVSFTSKSYVRNKSMTFNETRDALFDACSVKNKRTSGKLTKKNGNRTFDLGTIMWHQQ